MKKYSVILTVFLGVVCALAIGKAMANTYTNTGLAAYQYCGDGATIYSANGTLLYNGASSKTYSNGAATGCLLCHGAGGSMHSAGDYKDSYVFTGHKNMLRPTSTLTGLPAADAGIPWATSAGSAYPGSTTSGINWDFDGISTYNNASADIVNAALYYIVDGWGPTMWGSWGSASVTPIWDGGFADGNYSCAECHTTGYMYNGTAADYTYGGNAYPDYAGTANFPRVPGIFWNGKTGTCTDPSGQCTSSWSENGIECERCHIGPNSINDYIGANGPEYESTGNPAYLYGTGVINCSEMPGTPYVKGTGEVDGLVKPTGAAATALCIQCHTQESENSTTHTRSLNTTSDIAVGGAPVTVGGIVEEEAANGLKGQSFSGHWQGQTFLDSPHARYDGTLAMQYPDAAAAQAEGVPEAGITNVVFNGTYNSAFTGNNGGQGGCATCHDPHVSIASNPYANGGVYAYWGQSQVANDSAPDGMYNAADDAAIRPGETCASCHSSSCFDCHDSSGEGLPAMAANGGGGGTPPPAHSLIQGLPSVIDNAGVSPTVVMACRICHMPNDYHLMRINVDPNYTTMPTAAQYGLGQVTPNTMTEYLNNGAAYTNAVWIDINLACGQCHGGTNSEGQALPVATKWNGVTMNPAPEWMSTAQLAAYAKGMHRNVSADGGWAAVKKAGY